MENKEKLAEILTLLLDQKVTPDSNISMQDCELWDSMKHIEIITTLEEELGVSFNIEDIPKLTSFELLLNAIENKEQ